MWVWNTVPYRYVPFCTPVECNGTNLIDPNLIVDDWGYTNNMERKNAIMNIFNSVFSNDMKNDIREVIYHLNSEIAFSEKNRNNI